MELTSLSLLDRLRRQPAQDDWTRLVAIYKPFVERFIRLDSALAADADDICQEVLRKLVEHLPHFERQRDGSFRAWLKTVTVNEVNHFWRRSARDGRRAGAVPLLVDALQDPHNELSQQWDREHTNHLLAQLQDLIADEFSPQTWQAFRMRVFEEKSTGEVAAVLGLSKNAVDIAKSRVLTRLREESQHLVDD